MQVYLAVANDNSASSEGFRFRLGAIVSHSRGGMLSVVIGRQKTMKGRELYEIRPLRPQERAGREYRIILGDALVPVAGEPAASAMLLPIAV